ncbi:MAG: PolC-type DNA polymerase III [Saccharofermentans sp.]|nr:PolC-type DNA polymerase III [Saccharofermentans sp.]
MKNIISHLNMGPEYEAGLHALRVEKVDYYRQDKMIVILASGCNSLSVDNRLGEVLCAMSKATQCKIDLRFVDGSNADFSIIAPNCKSLFEYVSNCSFEDAEISFDNSTIVVRTRSKIQNVFNVQDRIRDYVMRAFDRVISVRIDVIGNTGAVAPIMPNSMFGLDAQTLAILEEEEKQKKEKAKAKEDAKKDAEKAPDKNSWVAKSQEQKANSQTEGNKPKFQPKKNADSIVGRVQAGAKKIDIKDLTDYDRNVNIEGRVKFLEDQTIADVLTLSRSGTTVIAKFYIVDKTGGVNALMFLKPQEADIFEKTFKKGGYAGFQVSTNYDKNERGVRVEGIYEATPPPKRKDLADYKRVELHVHSKMSEKDAVSDPEAIMKLADSFGHRACAITDHGIVQGFYPAYSAVKGINKGKEEGQEKFKAILGCEGYLVDDGPTIVYNLPFIPAKDDPDEPAHISGIGEFVAIRLVADGPDNSTDTFSKIAASKYRLKGYKGIKPVGEGETDEQAKEFASHDIDTSLWNPEEIPEKLRDENLPVLKEFVEDGPRHTINIHAEVKTPYSDDDIEYIPDSIEYEHVADFYADVEDIIYSGNGDPCDSYHRMGELVEFIGDAFVTGEDIFNTLGYVRRAGFGLNIEDHKFYRHKFLMPAISIEDIKKYVGDYSSEDYDKTGNELVDLTHKDASFVINYLIAQGNVHPEVLNEKVGHLSTDVIKSKNAEAYHIIYLVRNNTGLYNLYRLVSESHVHYYYRRPRTPKSLLKYFSSSIIIGGACERGEIYRQVLTKYKKCNKNSKATLDELIADEKFKDTMSLYDYVEIQPLTNNMFMTRQVPREDDPYPVRLNQDDILNINVLLADVADSFNKTLVATTDSHFLEKEDGMYRKFMLMDLGFADAEQQADLYFRTTDEMLDEFAYLGEERAFKAVVTNTNMIADMIEYGIKPFPDGTYPPMIARAASDVRDITYTRANQLYRHNGVLDEVVKARIEKELNSIIGNGFAIMYYIAYRLVKNSNNEGFIVGSRGSVGSSFVATMCGISEVNPLPPHHRCPKCNYVQFNNTGEYGSGYDLPLMNCPECGTEMKRDGQDIPFETFLGFFGDKQPDIDLNFSSLNQSSAHKYVEYLFGLTHTFRAGTVGAYADKNAMMVARKACEQKALPYTTGQLIYMSEGILGVKRTTSQHPGGIVVIPKEMDVYEFTPIQYPANKTNCGIITTHFDFHSLHDTILKLDILGHLDPTVLRMLHLLTGVEITSIPVPEPKVMSLLESTEVMGFPLEESEAGSATIGLSELGTPMARGMIKETKPTRFFDLVQLMGLSHGTDVWKGNAQDLINDGICDLNSVIGCRDSIMTQLIYWGLPNKDSFDIMEKVRKGKGLSAEHEALMREKNVPDWYIDSCKKIKYMFPKAHAAAYSISTLRVAWFKVYYPEEYYCTYFTVRGEEFDAECMCRGMDVLKGRMEELRMVMHNRDSAAKKAQDEFFICELVAEMYHRGIEFLPIDINTSHATNFTKVGPGKILPPLNSINSISSSMAEAFTAARDEAPFKTIEEMSKRGKLGQAGVQKLKEYGLLEGVPESSQIDLFSLLDGM